MAFLLPPHRPNHGVIRHIDRFGARGARFSRAYVQANFTRISFRAFQRSRYHSLDIAKLPFADIDTLLGAAGYATTKDVAPPDWMITDNGLQPIVSLREPRLAHVLSQMETLARPFYLHVHIMEPHSPYVPPGAHAVNVGTVDIAPTLLELIGLPLPPTFQGVSLMPLIRGQASSLKRHVLVVEGGLSGPNIALLWGAHKLIYYSDTDVWELFDLVADPREKHDLAAKEEGVVAQMSVFLETWQRARKYLPVVRARAYRDLGMRP